MEVEGVRQWYDDHIHLRRCAFKDTVSTGMERPSSSAFVSDNTFKVSPPPIQRLLIASTHCFFDADLAGFRNGFAG